MARDINKRLDQLRNRRTGLDRLGRLNTNDQFQILTESRTEESYQKRTQQPYTKYALGAMQEVGPKSTNISLEEAKRVGKQLSTGLAPHARPVDFEIQGSVACNIHIRGVSDVDLLVLDARFFSYDPAGVKARFYTSTVPYTRLEALQSLRSHAETILKSAYPEANVDTNGSKAINISGGSLRRPVDVVPSSWLDTADYQQTGRQEDRGVYILDKKAGTTVQNMPFRHIERIGLNDVKAMYGLKKAIRLAKNVKNDANEEGGDIQLSSFDIASALWHANLAALALGHKNELAILAETQRHLRKLADNHSLSKELQVPDGSRKIFDNDAKLRDLNKLAAEMDDLAFEVSREQRPALRTINPNWDMIDEALEKAEIPFM